MEDKLRQEYKRNLTKMFAHSITQGPVHGPEIDKWTKPDGSHDFWKTAKKERKRFFGIIEINTVIEN